MSTIGRMRNQPSVRNRKSRPILEPAIHSGILAAPLILMLALVVFLSGEEPKLSVTLDHTLTGSISPVNR